jgi:hypothetical protein
VKEILLISALFFSFVIKESFAQTSMIAKSAEDDANKIALYKNRCEIIDSLLVNKEYNLGCYTNYHHYGPTSKRSRSAGPIKIANYNLLHPGTSKALFKDYAIVASIMDQYDVVAGLELLATVGRDEQNNQAVVQLLTTSQAQVEKLRQQKTKLKDIAKIKELDEKIAKLLVDTDKAYDLYRAPGYLRILQELKKLDPSWSLILSPRGDSALIGSVEELVGYYYRANKVSPANNPHCAEVAGVDSGAPVACFITLTKDFMGKDYLKHFARRPFMASFKANGKKFTLIATHVVFTYSGDAEAEKDLMQKTFEVETYKNLGQGINGANFARFAEVKNTLEFMNRFRERYKDEKIMFMGDMNLVSSNAYWPEILKSFPGGELLIKEETTLSPTRYMITMKETQGVANDYDHFILDKKAFSECNDGEVYNYYKEGIYKDIETRYIIRKEVVGDTLPKRNKTIDDINELEHMFAVRTTNEDNVIEGDIPPVDDPATVKLEYPLTPAGQSKMDRFAANFEKYLTNLMTVKNNEVVADDFQIKERVEGIRRRVFLRQLTNPFYYRFMQEVVSDHFPVALTCNF